MLISLSPGIVVHIPIVFVGAEIMTAVRDGLNICSRILRSTPIHLVGDDPDGVKYLHPV